jgi:hypothetical protein
VAGALRAATQRQPRRDNSLPAHAPPATQPPIATYRSLLQPPIRGPVGAALAATQRQPPRGNSLPRQAPPAIQPPIATCRSLLQPQPPRAPSGRGALRRDPTLLGADRTESTPACWGNRRVAPRRAGAAPGDRPSYSAHQTPGSSEISPKKAASASTGVRRSRSRDRCRRDAARLWLLET